MGVSEIGLGTASNGRKIMTEDNQAVGSSADGTAKTEADYPVCSKCGFDDVVKDAWASWNQET